MMNLGVGILKFGGLRLEYEYVQGLAIALA